MIIDCEFSLLTVVETPEFIRKSTLLMDNSSKEAFINYIAENPLKGDLIVGTGGARKIRWPGHEHEGKRGGVRIIYHYHNENRPIFLFTVYAKNQRANITATAKKVLRKFIQLRHCARITFTFSAQNGVRFKRTGRRKIEGILVVF